MSQLRDGLRAQFASVVQIGGGQTVFSLQGDSARDLLAQGVRWICTRARSRSANARRRTWRSARAAAPTTGGLERSVVRRSFAGSLWQWLETAAS